MIDPELARRIRLVGLDVDGVLTDGGVYLGAVDGAPLEFKRYDIQDGVGLHLLRIMGIKLAIVTGRVSESVRMRARELDAELYQNADAQKLPGFLGICERCSVQPSEAAFIGDDFPDMPVLRIVGLPAAVGNATPEIRAECKVHLQRHGGRGAVREFCEMLLRARGEWDTAWQLYVAERSSPEGTKS